MSEEKKIKIGLICNKICSALVILFFINTCVIFPFLDFTTYLIISAVILVLFTTCSIIGHKFLKNYKPQ